jgi:ATP-dependent Clp protease protease subunit
VIFVYFFYIFVNIYIGEDKMVIPMIIDKEEGVEKSFDIYSRLLKDRIVFLSGEINDEVANLIVSELLYLNSLNNEDIYLYINSPGGSVTSGMAIYDTMNFIKCDVSTICVGMCASMAAFLLSSGAKGKRVCLKNGEVMIHQPLGGVQGQATEIKIHAERIIKLKEKLNKILASNTGKDIKKIERDTERDYYLDSEEALEYGLVDKVL